MFSQNVFGETITDRIPVQGTLWGSIGVNEATNKIYVGYYNANSISVIDGNTDKIVNSIPVNSAIYSIGVNPTTNMVYATHFGSDTVYVIDGSTDNVIRTIQVPATAVAVNPNTNRIYAVSGNTVSVIDGSTNTVVNTISTGNTSVPTSLIGVVVNPNTDMIYTSNNGGYENRGAATYVIDGKTNNVTATIHGINAGYLGINPDTNKIYVANDALIVIDGATNTWISAPEAASCVGVNPNTNKIYACDANKNNQVNVINGTDNNLISSLTGFTTATTIGVNPNINRIYVTDTYGNDVAVVGGSVPTTPQPPTGLTATAISSSQINLSWNTSSNNGGVAITGYKIERSSDSGTTWSAIISTTDSISTTYSDTGLAANTAYTYRVSAVNSVGTSSPSNTASATTNAVIASGIVLNNVQSTSGTTDSSNQITLSNFNATAGADRLLVVGVSANNNNVGSITFAGVPLAREVSHFTNNDAEFWYLTNPAGTGDITVTMNGPTQVVVGAYSFSGVNQTVPIPTHITRHNLTPSSPAISITTQYPNDLVLDLPSIYGGSTLGSPTCTQQWDVNVPNAITGASSSMIVPLPAIVTCGWTASSDDMWDDAAIELRAGG